MKRTEVICNTGPIIGLMSISRLDLLCELFQKVFIPQAVYDELCAKSITHQTDIRQIKEYVGSGKLKLYKVENQKMVKAMYGRLHFGELEVLVGAKEKNIEIAIIDDLSARKMANELLIDTIGIIGILYLAKREGLIDNIKKELDKLRESGYYISDKLYRSVLERMKEGEA
jgi:predicted nucleic acid-binding protein